jgi:hypothetical protein
LEIYRIYKVIPPETKEGKSLLFILGKKPIK